MGSHRSARVEHHLDKLVDEGILDTYLRQSKMPGLRWSLSAGNISHNNLTTEEVELFIEGTKLVLGRKKPQ